MDLLQFSAYRFTWYALPLFVSSLVALVLGILVLLRKRGAAATPRFFVLSLGLSAWLGSIALMFSAANESVAWLWAKAGYLAVPLLPPAAYHFASTLLRTHRRRQPLIRAFWGTGLAFVAVIIPTHALVVGLYHYPWGYYSRFGVLGIPLILLFAAAFGAIVTDFLVAERTSFGVQRSRVRAMTAALAVGFLASIDFLPSFGIELYPLGYAVVLLALFLAYRAVRLYGFADMTPALAAREIVDTMADALIVCDTHGIVQLVNPAVAVVLGYTEEELVGRNIETLADPDSTIGSSQRLKSAVGRGTSREQERVFRKKDGTLLDVSISIAPLGDNHGENGAVILVRDMTERNAAHRAIRMSEERYRLLYENNLAGVYRSTLAGVITECNAACARMLGFPSAAALVGQRLGEMHRRRGEREELLDMVVKARKLPSVELQLNRADGSQVWVIETLNLITDGGEPTIQGTLVDITDQKNAQEQIEYHAYHDVLTCLPNRTLFLDRLTHALLRSEREPVMTGILILDLDHFKIINETHGHTTGDELILAIAERLSRVVRRSDTVARAGGDEFLILMHKTDANRTAALARSLLEIVAEPIKLASREIYTTASIGIALAPIDGIDAETLLKSADAALYQAKDLGRNTFHLATPDINRRAATRLALEHSLHRALERDEFTLHYQPIVDSTTRKPVAVEALIRWQNPERGLLVPSEFMNVIEEGPLIIPVGAWVLRTACAQAHAWRQNGLPNLRIAVNLSPRQFYDAHLVTLVQEILERTGLDPHALELEITEGTAARDVEVTKTVLGALRDMGIGIAIDDFGTGYSALNYLRRFPITSIKIDQSFVREMTTNDGDAAIVGAILAIADKLGLHCIAEGVESDEQYSMLREHGCKFMQGYLFSKPLAAADVSAFTLGRRFRLGAGA